MEYLRRAALALARAASAPVRAASALVRAAAPARQPVAVSAEAGLSLASTAVPDPDFV